MNVNYCETKGYVNKCDWALGEKKANQSQFARHGREIRNTKLETRNEQNSHGPV
jgi:hypothetical protein